MKLIAWFRKISERGDPLVGKTVIRFTTHGCMAQNHEFDFIGTIIASYKAGGRKIYKVEVLKEGCLEKRDGNLKRQLEHVPSWYLQNIGGDFLVAYD